MGFCARACVSQVSSSEQPDTGTSTIETVAVETASVGPPSAALQTQQRSYSSYRGAGGSRTTGGVLGDRAHLPMALQGCKFQRIRADGAGARTLCRRYLCKSCKSCKSCSDCARLTCKHAQAGPTLNLVERPGLTTPSKYEVWRRVQIPVQRRPSGVGGPCQASELALGVVLSAHAAF